MDRILVTDPWKIVEQGFDPAAMRESESLFSLGNGAMGGRGNFEETYSGDTLPGHYVGGIFYPDKTRVGWWKNGYPESFAKVLNAAFWIGVEVMVEGETLDLNQCEVTAFRRELDMRRGVLTRLFEATLPSGRRVSVQAERFVSLARLEAGAVRYRITPLGAEALISLEAFVDGDVRNEDANYDEHFWEQVGTTPSSLTMRTRKSGFTVCWAQHSRLSTSTGTVPQCEITTREGRIGERFTVRAAADEAVVLEKVVGITSSQNHVKAELRIRAEGVATSALEAGFETLLGEHTRAWAEKWEHGDIQIGGDDKAQQGIRFCIFQLLQTYTGHDARLNIGPKGFTGEKYGGSTYWDTEAYCFPFYLSSVGEQVARQLLTYRYNQLPQAIENAAKLGFTDGAALYPMVTMTGQECHNEWEITFEEIHRNGAIARAVDYYCRYTGSRDYLAQGGLEVLIGIARFWVQRVNWSDQRQGYVMLGVTGPNEYENNVNNNWYTNYIARWCLRYAAEAARWVGESRPDDYRRIVEKTGLKEAEFSQWEQVARELVLPQIETAQGTLFLQQDGYLDKEQRLARELAPDQRPINQHWSWDRILRSCFIKQADVLQGLYFFQDDFDRQTLRCNFDFYEPRTVHESSLSPCVHAILAARLDDADKAYELYLRTARLDLDDYNREIREGLHVTSMAGSWLAVVEGFGGVCLAADGTLSIDPKLPRAWQSLRFRINYRNALIDCLVTPGKLLLTSSEPVQLSVRGVPAVVDTHPFQIAL